MSDDGVLELRVELRRTGGPGGDWRGVAYDGPAALAEVHASSPGEVLEELAIELDRLETAAIVAARRLRDRQE